MPKEAAVDPGTLVGDQRRFFQRGGHSRDVRFRIAALKRMRAWIRAHDEEIMAALSADLGKARFEGYATEIGVALDEINYLLGHLRSLAKDRRVPTPIKQFPSRCFIRKEPYGCVLIMSPWNYPFQLGAVPLAGAIAAGNCAVLKPSAYAPKTAAVLAKMAGECFDQGHVAAVQGGREENQGLLRQKFDYIFFTGSVAVGKWVMSQAAQNLTPVTLELGGKSPCIVDETADMTLAARRIAWGKFLNAGQTCVAPDYLLAHESVKDRLIAELQKCVRGFFGEDPLKSRDYPSIVNMKHFMRLAGLMEGADIPWGGQTDMESLKIAPTLLDGVDAGHASMQEEIFGPILPVLPYRDLQEAIDFVNARPRPLALYLFTKSKENEKRVLGNVTYGGGCVNDAVVHMATPYMPFGGVGDSGMGCCHGRWGFDTFTHEKSIMKKSLKIDLPLRYAPYREAWLGLLRKM
ncbi:MAG: aldehyde dehydrogenase [Lachnospiraceae bacterium]|nr:aldehyde dehydrogenase [Lachnospiraceae bacterium]